MAVILRSQQTFYSEVIPDAEYASKIAITISNILHIWSML